MSDASAGQAGAAAISKGASASGRMVVLLCLVQFVLWTVVPALLNRTPPTDTMESFLWGRQWLLLSYKHPQLPSWLLEITYHLTGSYVWTGFLLSQVAVCVTFVCVYGLGCEIMGDRAALAGLLLLPTTGFFNWGTRQWNHDIAQLPFWAAICWLLWRAARDNRLRDWLLLGLVAGAGLYAKFSTGLIILFGAAWLFVEPQARRRMASRGPWIAMALVTLFALPIFIDMARMKFIQLTYASTSNDWVLIHRGRLYYIGVQLALMIVFPFALRFSGLWKRGAEEPAGVGPILVEDRRARHYLLWMGLGPALLLMLCSPFTGVGEAWGKPMYNLVGLVAVAYLGARLSDRVMRRLAGWGFGTLLFVVAVYAVFAPTQCYLKGRLSNTCLPGAQIAARLQDEWHREINAPLGVVAGEEGLMMPVAIFASDRPSMFTEFNPAYSPWVTERRLHRQGMLIVWAGSGPPPADWSGWTKGRTAHQASFPWAPGFPPLVVSYILIPPGATGLPALKAVIDPATM